MLKRKKFWKLFSWKGVFWEFWSLESKVTEGTLGIYVIFLLHLFPKYEIKIFIFYFFTYLRYNIGT